jgi:hypothetical protein
MLPVKSVSTDVIADLLKRIILPQAMGFCELYLFRMRPICAALETFDGCPLDKQT